MAGVDLRTHITIYFFKKKNEIFNYFIGIIYRLLLLDSMKAYCRLPQPEHWTSHVFHAGQRLWQL